MVDDSKQLYTVPFLLLCVSHTLFGGSFSMIIPELPGFLTSLGGKEYKGLIIALFTLSAGLSRPFSGKLADTVGRIPVMVFGTLVCVVCSLLYPFLSSVAGFLFLRFLHGFSTGFKPTASTAFAADIIPAHRRGEAMGILGISMNIGASAFPPIGSWLAIQYSIDIMFYASSFLALISIMMLMGLRETLEDQQKFHPSLLKMSLNEIIEIKALPPALVTIFIYFTFGVLLTISPDQSEYLGLENKGLIFTSITFCSILSRAVAGKVSDIYGRVIVIKMSIVLMVFAHCYMAIADSPFDLLVSSSLEVSQINLLPFSSAWPLKLFRLTGKGMTQLSNSNCNSAYPP